MSSSAQPALGFIGTGRAGSALAVGLHDAGYPVTAVYSRSPENARLVARRTGALVCASPCDTARLSEFLFLTVPDDAVGTVTEDVASKGGFRMGGAAVHTSGVLTVGALTEAERRGALTGVFHPLQALAGAPSSVLLRGAYVGVEGAEDLMPVLRDMAADLGAQTLELAGADRLPYHVAAVLASSYTLALVASASDLMAAAGFHERESLAALLPLVRGSIANLERGDPSTALTGPAVRGDASTVALHLEYLRRTHPALVEVYRKLGLLTLNIAGDSPERQAVREELER